MNSTFAKHHFKLYMKYSAKLSEPITTYEKWKQYPSMLFFKIFLSNLRQKFIAYFIISSPIDGEKKKEHIKHFLFDKLLLYKSRCSKLQVVSKYCISDLKQLHFCMQKTELYDRSIIDRCLLEYDGDPRTNTESFFLPVTFLNTLLNPRKSCEEKALFLVNKSIAWYMINLTSLFLMITFFPIRAFLSIIQFLRVKSCTYLSNTN